MDTCVDCGGAYRCLSLRSRSGKKSINGRTMCGACAADRRARYRERGL